jgi:hypothetical protein
MAIAIPAGKLITLLSLQTPEGIRDLCNDDEPFVAGGVTYAPGGRLVPWEQDEPPAFGFTNIEAAALSGFLDPHSPPPWLRVQFLLLMRIYCYRSAALLLTDLHITTEIGDRYVTIKGRIESTVANQPRPRLQ